jgi:adenylate cyclase
MLMSEALEGLSSVITNYGGVIDKYIGDCIMCFWQSDDQVMQSVSCALACREFMSRMSESWIVRSLPALECRIGINTGQVLIGNFGSSRRFSFTVIGDTVNLASRVEALNKSYDSTVLITEYTHDKLPKDTFITRRIEHVAVKGKEIPVWIYEVMKNKKEADENDMQLLEMYNTALSLLMEGKFEMALTEFDILETTKPDSVITRKKEQCKKMLAKDMHEWDGIMRMEEK